MMRWTTCCNAIINSAILMLILTIDTEGSNNTSFPSLLQPQPGSLITISVHGDSLSSCSGVSGDFSFAYLSYREALWTVFLQPKYGHHRLAFVGSRYGCNRHVDASFPNATRFPNFHDAYFGRTAAAMRRDWRRRTTTTPPEREVVGDNGGSAPLQSIAAGNMALLLIGTNDFLLRGKANASEVAALILSLVDDLHSNRNSAGAFTTSDVLVGIPPTMDALRAKVSSKRAKRWEAYRRELHEHLSAACSQQRGVCRTDGDRGDAPKVWSLVTFDAWMPTVHTYDGLHPNKKGELVLARRWFDAMQPSLDLWLSGGAQSEALKGRVPDGTINPVLSGSSGGAEPRDVDEVHGHHHEPSVSIPLVVGRDALWVSVAVLLLVFVGSRCRRRRPVG